MSLLLVCLDRVEEAVCSGDTTALTIILTRMGVVAVVILFSLLPGLRGRAVDFQNRRRSRLESRDVFDTLRGARPSLFPSSCKSDRCLLLRRAVLEASSVEDLWGWGETRFGSDAREASSFQQNLIDRTERARVPFLHFPRLGTPRI